MAHTSRADFADILFPQVTETPETVIQKYPPRALPADAAVTRFAPSPTGAMHIGGVYAALVERTLAHQTGGTFLLRIEDTDKNREIENGVSTIVEALHAFELDPDEGIVATDEAGAPTSVRGEYGPYLQSDRRALYHVFAKELVRLGAAYPCFCSAHELDASRAAQEDQKIKTGYYGAWAVHRDMREDDVRERIRAGEPFALRLRAPSAADKITFVDLIRGSLTFPENDIDAVLVKSDGLPTYHFAHVVDDFLMRVTHVVRGDEWLSSTPLHLQLFAAFGWRAPHYAHFSPIMKRDGAGKRKLSKRKDPEASVSFYFKEGYPVASLHEYLLTLANSNFEDWRREHKTAPREEFKFSLTKIQPSGALFDFVKLNSVSAGVVARMSAEEVYHAVHTWAEQYDAELFEKISADPLYATKIFGIERAGDTRRKDIAKWADVRAEVAFFYDDWFANAPETFEKNVPAGMSLARARELLSEYLIEYLPDAPKDAWLAGLRSFATAHGAPVGEIAALIRLALTKRTKAPDLYEVMHVLGEARVRARLEAA